MVPPENPLKTSPQMISTSEDVADSRIETQKNQAFRDGTSSSSSSGGGGSSGNDEEPCCSREENGGDRSSVVVDMTSSEEPYLEAEKVCRICHLSNEQTSGSSELMQLGCHCKEELGLSHRQCAEAWFKRKGNRLCEICNHIAKNVRLMKEPRIYVMEVNEMRPMAVISSASSSSSSFESTREGSRRCKQSCNFVLACLVLAFLTSTFLRIKWF